MAKITMDTSEYEVMKENKKLLENSLEKERSLQEEIKKLNEEKLKALEDAKMKIVKISKTERTDFVMKRRDDHEVWGRLFQVLGVSYHTRVHEWMSVDSLIEAFFQRGTSISHPPVTEVTTHGLDEIKAEIREELKREMDTDIKDKLETAGIALSQHSGLMSRNSDLVRENDELKKNIKGLTEIGNSMNREIDRIYKENRTINEIQGLLHNGYTFWNKSKILDKIISLIK